MIARTLECIRESHRTTRGSSSALHVAVGLTLLGVLAGARPAFAETTVQTADSTTTSSNLGGPDQVDNQLETDSQPKESLFRFPFLDPYFAFKDRLKTKSGLGFGLDYTTIAMKASASLDEDHTWGGMVRLFGSWELVGRGSEENGAIVFKVEHRHAYSTVPVSSFGLNTGYVGVQGAPFSDEGFRVTNLYWRQRLAPAGFTFFAGFLDATDYFDVYIMASPWLHFMNLAFSTGSATLAYPNDAFLGIAAGGWFNDHFYAKGGVGDNASDPSNPFTGFDRFFNVREYFTALEVGWTTSRDRGYFDNVHVGAWHSDAKSEVGDPSGWGVVFSATTYLKDRMMPFLRGGYSKDGGTLLEKSVSAGIGYQQVPYRDLLGFGFNWGVPNPTTFGAELRDQYTFEVFWRWYLGQRLAVTPDVQYLIHPALNPAESAIWLFGFRLRLAL